MKKIMSIATLLVALVVSVSLTASSNGPDGTTTAYIYTADCVDCGACEDVCPTEAIYEGYNSSTQNYHETYAVDPEICVACGACVDTCPVGAIWMGGAWVKKH